MVVSMYYKECEVMIGKVRTWVDLVKLWRMDYHVILEMDWLLTHHAHVDCHQNRVTSKMGGISECSFE